MSLWIKSQSSHCSLFFYFLSSVILKLSLSCKLQLISLYYFTYFPCLWCADSLPPHRVDSFLFNFVCINLALSTVQFEILTLLTHCCQPRVFTFYCILKPFFFQIYIVLGLIWKQDPMIKPYILILLYTIDVFVFILKMTCWCSNKAITHCVRDTQ